MTATMPVIIPAAGLGTRLMPLTDACSKELLPLGGATVLFGAWLECHAAAVARVAVVTSSRKPDLDAWLRRPLLDPRPIRVEQADPAGVLDAVARARLELPPPPHAVLFPDHLHLPGQTALAAMLEARSRGLASLDAGAARALADGVVFALYQASEETLARVGPTVRVDIEPLTGDLVRVTAAHPPRPTFPGAWHTCFAEIQGPGHAALVDAAAPDDGRLLSILQSAAAAGRFFGVRLDGAVLDVGRLTGYRDAVDRFESGAAAWREQP